MPEEYNKILKYNKGVKSMKSPFIFYADLEPLLEKTNTCHNNPEKSSTNKINKTSHSLLKLLFRLRRTCDKNN